MSKVRVRTSLATLGLTAIALACLYQFGLSDEAKAKLKSTLTSVKDSYARVAKVVEDIQGVTMKDDQPLPNAQSTAAQWSAIGF